MSYLLSRQLKYATRASIDSATFTGAYQLLGSVPKPGSIVKIVNNSNKDIDVSDNGVRDCDFVPANGYTLYDISTNGREEDRYFPQGPIYVKGAAGAGLVYLVVLTPGA